MTYERAEAIELFLKAVAVDSPSFYEIPMVDFVVGYVKEKGWKCEIIRQKVQGDMLPEKMKRQFGAEILSFKTEQLQIIIEGNDVNKEAVFLCAHLDTVEPGRNIRPVFDEKKGIITSDGTTVLGGDDKSGVCAVLCAVDNILRKKLPHGKLVLLFNAMEEPGHIGANLVDINKFGVSYGYVFDTMLNVGRMVLRAQHGRVLTATFEVKDMPNHTYACTVTNSLTAASIVAARLEKGLFDEEKMTFGQVISLENTYAAGYMAPRKSVLKYVLRSFDAEETDRMTSNAERILNEYFDPNIVTKYRFDPETTIGYDMRSVDKGEFLMNKAAAALREMNIQPEYIDKGLGNHDASAFIAQGVPCLVLSSGMREIHTVKEYVYAKDLSDCCILAEKLILSA